MMNMNKFGQGLLQNPMFNMGIGLLSARGQPEGLLTGMNQYRNNMQAAQAQQYQQAIMEQIRKKAEAEAQQKMQREQANRMMATAQVPGMVEGAGPIQPGMPIPQEPGMVPQVNEKMLGVLNAYPQVAEEMVKQSVLPAGMTDDVREYRYAVQQGYKGSFPEWMDKIKKGQTTNLTIRNDKFSDQLGRGMAENVISQYDKMQGIRDSLIRMDEAENLLNSGMVTGSLANFKVGFGKLLQEVGINLGQDEISNTESFAAFMGNETAQIIKEFGAGTGLSDADREYAEKIAGGKITLTEDSIRKLFKLRRKYSKQALNRYNEKAQKVSEKYGDQLAYPISIEIPEEKPEEKLGRTSNRTAGGPIKIGHEEGGYIYQGGDPGKPENWKKK